MERREKLRVTGSWRSGVARRAGDGDGEQLGVALYRPEGACCANATPLAINGDAVAVRPFAVVAERRERRGRARGHGRAGGGWRKRPAVVLCRTTGGTASIWGARGVRAPRAARGRTGSREEEKRREEKGKRKGENEKKKKRRKEKEKREEKKKGEGAPAGFAATIASRTWRRREAERTPNENRKIRR